MADCKNCPLTVTFIDPYLDPDIPRSWCPVPHGSDYCYLDEDKINLIMKMITEESVASCIVYDLYEKGELEEWLVLMRRE